MTIPKKNKTKEVLERLKSQESRPKPKLEDLSSFKNPQQKKAIITNQSPSGIYQTKLERVMNRLNDLEKKMKQSEDFFTNYWEYSKACKEFTDVLIEFEKFDKSFVPTQFKKKIEVTKTKVNTHLNRKIPKTKDYSKPRDPIDKY